MADRVPATAHLFAFVKSPLAFLTVLAGLVSTYLGLVKVVKEWFYKRHAESRTSPSATERSRAFSK